ncbi:protein kinase domain-containing protein [Paractinoplanes durhamensis]|uniref:protein kinase domain-containing protein n=1 Tax=Paractinoplanes durhamensis TaxID=113563 RepID=UPI003639AE1B
MTSFDHSVSADRESVVHSDPPAGRFPGPATTLGGLEVVDELGRGENTVVYRVRREETEYALKIRTASDPDLAGTLRLFRREAAMLAGLNHPGVPRIHQAGEDAGRPYIVMDLVDGRQLAEQLSRGPLSASQTISIALDVTEALRAVHRAGLVHRDIKPENIMVLRTGAARLIDFGFATLNRAREQDGRADLDESVVGTLAYAAPEQSRILARPVDQRSDLYSLGVVLFQCVTGRLPFVSDVLGELLRMHLTTPAPRADEVAVGIGSGIAAVIQALLAKDPDDRYQSCDDLLADIRLLAADPGAALAPTRSGAQSARTRMTGRNTELTTLVDRWARAARGHGGVCLVRGPSGIGKSRLLRELTGLAGGQGALVLAGKCAPDDAVPLAAVRAAIDNHLRAVATLPEQASTEAYQRLRRAAGVAAPLLGALSPSLRTLLAAGDLADEDRSGQFETAVIDLLRGLARQYAGLLLVVDDVQWLDTGSMRLLTQLAEEMADIPLMLVTTVRDDDASRAAAERFTDAIGSHLDLDLVLMPMADAAIAALIADHLPGIEDSPLARLLTTRGQGNPFVVIEYLRAVLDAGMVTPSWGGWRVDEEGLAALELPGDAIGLVLARVADMGSDNRRLLTVAAVAGGRFRLGLVAGVSGFRPARAAQLIQEAEERGLVEGLGGGRYAFLHDRIREALLADLDEVAVARLNQDLAEAMDEAERRGEPDDPSAVYGIARHYMLGVGAPATRIVEVCFAAARLALEEYAPARAVGFMAHAESFGEFDDAALHRQYGIALARDGQHTEAKAYFAKALDLERDQLRRAELRVHLANVFRANWDTTGTLLSVRDGLADADSWWPGNRVLLVASTAWTALAGLAVATTRIGAGSASGRTQERFSLVCDLHEVGVYGCLIGLQPKEMVLHGLSGLYAAARLGPSPQYVRVVGSLGLMLGALGLRRSARKAFVIALEVAERLGDPRLIADVASQRGAAEFLNSSDDGEAWEAVLSEHGRWLDAGRYSDGVAAICWELASAGRTAENLAWYQRGKAKVRYERDTTALVTGAALARAVLGEFAEASTELRRVHALLTGYGGRGLQANAVLTNLYALAEQRDFGATFDGLVSRFREFVVAPRLMIRPHRMALAIEAIGRVAQYRQMTAGTVPGTGFSRRFVRRRSVEVSLARARAYAAVRKLRRLASTPLLRARASIVAADMASLDGNSRAGLRILAKAGPVRRDAPIVAFDAAVVRARCHLALGEVEESRRQARYAQAVAVEQRWPHRERWIFEEFEIGEDSGVHTHR